MEGIVVLPFRSFLPLNWFLVSSGRKCFSHTLVYSVKQIRLCFLVFLLPKPPIPTFCLQRKRKKWNISFFPLIFVKRTFVTRDTTIFATATARRSQGVVRHVWCLSTRASLSCFARVLVTNAGMVYSSQCLKILSQYTVKKTRIDWQRFEMYCLREMSIVEPRYFERGLFEVPAISKEGRIPLDLPFPFTLPRLFRNPAISNFFSNSFGTSK